MSKNEKTVATRVAYGNALKDLGSKYNFFVMDADLSSSTQTSIFAAEYPDRFINCGIAEANMISTAAGIASTGVPVFASSFSMFAVGRAYEQIRNSVAYPKLNVKICASHAGISVGEDGASHQYCEDLAVMRSVPNMLVVCPADAVEAYAAVEALLNYDGPAYLRLARLATPILFDENNYKFDLGKGVALREGDDIAIFSTGMLTTSAVDAADQLKEQGINVSVINIHTLKPIDKEIIVKYAEKCNLVMTVEEHSIIGGLGSAVAEVLSENRPTRLIRMGMNDVFGRSGKALELMAEYGLTSSAICEKVKAVLSK